MLNSHLDKDATPDRDSHCRFEFGDNEDLSLFPFEAEVLYKTYVFEPASISDWQCVYPNWKCNEFIPQKKYIGRIMVIPSNAGHNEQLACIVGCSKAYTGKIHWCAVALNNVNSTVQGIPCLFTEAVTELGMLKFMRFTCRFIVEQACDVDHVVLNVTGKCIFHDEKLYCVIQGWNVPASRNVALVLLDVAHFPFDRSSSSRYVETVVWSRQYLRKSKILWEVNHQVPIFEQFYNIAGAGTRISSRACEQAYALMIARWNRRYLDQPGCEYVKINLMCNILQMTHVYRLFTVIYIAFF